MVIELAHVGSSPLARGTLFFAAAVINRCRLIPARAGNMSSLDAAAVAAAAHPRSRGEHRAALNDLEEMGGSSPLARGTFFLTSLRTLKAMAHPRSRGEHLTIHKLTAGDGGSSPLARGTFHRFDVPAVAIRLIPARAGNILGHAVSLYPTSAHPRSRGEHDELPVRGFLWCGSSPLARGTYECFVVHRVVFRLIPARAGNMAGAACQ